MTITGDYNKPIDNVAILQYYKTRQVTTPPALSTESVNTIGAEGYAYSTKIQLPSVNGGTRAYAHNPELRDGDVAKNFLLTA